eukprot:jgi/Mesen1/7888/ME000420S07036
MSLGPLGTNDTKPLLTPPSSFVSRIGPPFNPVATERAPAVHIRVTQDSDDVPLLEVTSAEIDESEGSVASSSSESSSQPVCRICLESEGEDLIAPCQCRGTQKYVHRRCLDTWRTAKEGFSFAHCTECKALFRLRVNVPADRRWRRRLFRLLVARDHLGLFLLVQLVVAALGVLLYEAYGKKLMDEFGYAGRPYAFFTAVVVLAVFVGLLYGSFVAIICAQRIHERHHHVLQREELTKEYVVEDTMGDDSWPPESLPAEHARELRSLGLL